MLDALIGLVDGGKSQKQAQELEALIAKAQEERLALSAMLSRLAVHSSTIAETSHAIEDVQRQILQSNEELHVVRQSIDQAAALRGELEQLGNVVRQLTEDYSKARDISREADDNAFAALEAVKDIERRVSRLDLLQELGRNMDEKLTALHSLAEHVAQSTRILEGQKEVIDRAVAGTSQVDKLLEKMGEQLLALTNLPGHLQDFSLQFERLATQAEDLEQRQADLATQEVRLRDLREISGSLAADTTERLGQIQDLNQTLAQAVSFKDELIKELAQVYALQREALGRTEAAEGQIQHVNESLANMGAVMQDAKDTLRLLSQERELAERIEQSIRQLRDRPTGCPEEGR